MREITSWQEAKDAIERWLKGNRHDAKLMEDEAATFHIEVDYPPQSQKRQRIIQPKDYEDMVLLLNGVSTAPEHREKLKTMDPEERERFYSSLRKELMFAESSFDMNLDEEGVVQQVQFSLELYFDGLSKTSLFKSLLAQHRALLYIVTSLNERFGVPTFSAADVTAG